MVLGIASLTPQKLMAGISTYLINTLLENREDIDPNYQFLSFINVCFLGAGEKQRSPTHNHEQILFFAAVTVSAF